MQHTHRYYFTYEFHVQSRLFFWTLILQPVYHATRSLVQVTYKAASGVEVLSPWKAGLHHFVAYVMGVTGRDWGDQNLPPIQ